MQERLIPNNQKDCDKNCVLESRGGRPTQCPNNPKRFPENYKSNLCPECVVNPEAYNSLSNESGESDGKEQDIGIFEIIQEVFVDLEAETDVHKSCGLEGLRGRPEKCPNNEERHKENHRPIICQQCPTDPEIYKVALLPLPALYIQKKQEGLGMEQRTFFIRKKNNELNNNI